MALHCDASDSDEEALRRELEEAVEQAGCEANPRTAAKSWKMCICGAPAIKPYDKCGGKHKCLQSARPWFLGLCCGH